MPDPNADPHRAFPTPRIPCNLQKEMDAFERQYIEYALRSGDDVISHAAGFLGMDRDELVDRMTRLRMEHKELRVPSTSYSAEEDEGAKQVILSVLGELTEPVSLPQLFENPRVHSAVAGDQGQLAFIMGGLVGSEQVARESHMYTLKR